MERARSLLFVADATAQSGPVVEVLRGEGHRVDVEAHFARGVAQAARGLHDLVILDLKRADLDGAELCQKMRTAGVRVPILILATRAGEADMVVTLDAGADEYVIKPFRVAELLARVRVLLRRDVDLHADGERPVVIDAAARRAFLNGHELTLTAKEFDLLAMLLREEQKVVPRQALIAELWGDGRKTKSLDMHVVTLRRKLGDDAIKPHHITTIRGVGFRLENSPQESTSLARA